MTLAQTEARQLNHDFVGTEHILLALLIERPGALEALGVTADAIRQQISQLVTPGLAQPPVGAISLTPRARSVIDYARLETSNHGQKLIEPEHLLLGLIHEPDGVAGRVMRNLGLDLRQVHEKSLKLRLEQMRIVERAVRPLRAQIARKRKMREELLAHLSEIYEEEYQRLADPDAALHEAAKRFGDPAQLSRELQGSQKWDDRLNYWFERWFGWRPPESAARWMLRVSFLFLGVMLCTIAIPIMIEMIIDLGPTHLDAVGLRAIAAMMFFMPLGALPCQCLLTSKSAIRFSAYLALENRLPTGILRAGLVSLCVMLCSACAIATLNASFQPVAEFTVPLIAVSIFGGITCLILAQVRGPIEIRDTLWACMDLKTAE